MKKVLIIEVAVLLVLAAVVVGIWVSDDRQEDSLSGSVPQPSATVTQPAQTTPSSTAPSVTEPPVTEPPVTEPPVTEPPVTEPPVTEPPMPTEPLIPAFLDNVQLRCRDYFVYDGGTQSLLAVSQSADRQIYPASITKLFTAYVALQYLEPEKVIKVGDEASMIQEGSSIAYVRKGHKLTVAQLIEGMLLPSGNDAAYVLAAAAGRASGGAELSAEEAVAEFVRLMNVHAQDLGMTGTQFQNPDGYHAEGHYTTSADMITIAQLALADELIRTYTSTSQDKVVYASGHTNTWHNTNALIDPESPYYCPEAVGLKTGNTDEAGYCLLSAFEIDGSYVIIGVFGCEEFNDRFVDSLALYQAVRDFLKQ